MLKEIDERILNLKAALWENGDIETLLSKAIRAYIDNNAPKQPKANSYVYLEGKEILIKNVPHIQKNGKIFENILLMAALEDLIEERYHEKNPQVIEFELLLK